MTTPDHKCEALRLLEEAEQHIAAAEHESAEIEQARIACRRAQQCLRAHHMAETCRHKPERFEDTAEFERHCLESAHGWHGQD